MCLLLGTFPQCRALVHVLHRCAAAVSPCHIQRLRHLACRRAYNVARGTARSQRGHGLGLAAE
nr:MAG TPA: hypothetical protein [Caudoviricetes sp.]